MIDPGESPLQAALRELAEETGWLLLPEDLTPLHEKPLYPSPAFWHESGFFYAARLMVPATVLEAYAQKPFRYTPAGEKLFLLALPPDQILSTTQNLQTLAHTLLYYAHHGTPYRVLPPPTS
jgi:8-oxo-dGTP pyrophosphatase MutT (NUDIX family)